MVSHLETHVTPSHGRPDPKVSHLETHVTPSHGRPDPMVGHLETHVIRFHVATVKTEYAYWHCRVYSVSLGSGVPLQAVLITVTMVCTD